MSDVHLHTMLEAIKRHTGLTQEEIADRISYSRTHLSDSLKKGASTKLMQALRLAFSDALSTKAVPHYKESAIMVEEAHAPYMRTVLEKGNVGIPYYLNTNASAGLNFLTANNDNESVPIIIPNIDAQAFINVFGDSMYPKYCSGEIIGVKEIQKDMLHFGYAYVIQMKDGESYLKYIKPGRDENHWILESENPRYPPREFHLKQISKIFIIKAVITKTTLS